MTRLLLLLFLLPAATLGAAEAPSHGRYEPRVPAPSSRLGFELGARPAHHAEVVAYFEELAERSPHARLFRHGLTHEARDLIHLVISSEANLARLDSIRATIGQLADPRRAIAPADLESALATTPAVVYLAYSIHGDELSGGDAALQVAYELAAGRDERARQLRDSLVVILDPLENPDGRERFLAMTASFTGEVPNPDPDSLSHTAFWPWGRTNHYLFDLNRDWFALVHPESQARVELLTRWHPQLVVDAHEMGGQSTFLLNPPRAPFNPNLPVSTREWWDRFGADHASAFGEHGWSFYAGEWNEEFFPGYGSSLSLYRGATALLYEQAGTDGGPLRRQDGRVFDYRQAVEQQTTSSMANLETAATSRRQLLEKWRAARTEAVSRGAAGPLRVIYVAPGADPVRAVRLVDRLLTLGIEVERLEQAGTVRRARDPWHDGASAVELPAGSYRVRLDQPEGLLARAILEPHTPMDDASLAEEREHIERQKGSRIYDTTAWSPLLAYGLEAHFADRLDDLLWRPVTGVIAPVGWLEAGDLTSHPYGLVFDCSRDGAVVLAAKLAASGVRVRVGDRPFTVGGQGYPRGSFLIRHEDNPQLDGESIETLAHSLGVEIRRVATARVERGPDLGADRYELLSEPRIAILAGAPLSVYSVGAAWHLLDRTYGLRVSLVDIGGIARIDLDRYNVIVLPDSWSGADGYRRSLGEAGVKALLGWAESGGTLVGIGAGALLAADPTSDWSQVRARSAVLSDFAAPRYGLADDAVAALERLQATGLDADGRVPRPAGAYAADGWPDELGIPGPGSPILGPGTWALLSGPVGERARARELRPVGADDGGKSDKNKTEKDAKPSKSEPQSSEAEKTKALTRADERLKRFSPSGAILRAELDPEHWLSAGVGARVAVMVRADDTLIARDPVRTVGRFAPPEELHLGGLLWPEAAGRIAATAFLTREGKGRGQIILFSDDPNFRGYFWGTQRLFLNAILLGPGLGTRPTIPW